MPTFKVERTSIKADIGVESIEWVKRERFPSNVSILPCKDVWAAAYEAKGHVDGL